MFVILGLILSFQLVCPEYFGIKKDAGQAGMTECETRTRRERAGMTDYTLSFAER